MQQGTVTAEQARLIFGELPCDISFADENDVLQYWSGATYDTCDARFIGRDLRECHPQESLATLERILAEFKAGQRTVAEGWQTEDGHCKFTRYTAVRDEAGTYRGILEVNIDLTRFRALEGTQAIPGWDTPTA